MKKKPIILLIAVLMAFPCFASACGRSINNGSSSQSVSIQQTSSSEQSSVELSSGQSTIVSTSSTTSSENSQTTTVSPTASSSMQSSSVSDTTPLSSASSSSSVSVETIDPTPISGSSGTVTPNVGTSANTSAEAVSPNQTGTSSSGSSSETTSVSVWNPDIYDYDNITPSYDDYNDDTKYDYSNVTYTAKQGSFTKSGTAYTTTAANTIAVNTSVPFPYGSISTDLTYVGGDSGIIFGYTNTGSNTWEGSGISFYFLFINAGNFHLGKSYYTTSNQWETLGTQCMGTNDTNHTYNLRIVLVSNKMICMIDNLVAFTVVDDAFLTGTGFGFRAGTSGTKFSNFTVTNDYDFESEDYLLDNDYNYTYDSTFTTLQGSFTLSGTTHTASENDSLMVNTTPFRYGSIQVDITASSSGDNGIVFGYTNYGSATWEGASLSYYFLFINYQGIVILGKSDNGSWGTVAQSGKVVTDFTVSHNLLLVYKEREITVYLDNVKLFSAMDPAPLFGAGYGIRAGNSGVTFANFTITSEYLK